MTRKLLKTGEKMLQNNKQRTSGNIPVFSQNDVNQSLSLGVFARYYTCSYGFEPRRLRFFVPKFNGPQSRINTSSAGFFVSGFLGFEKTDMTE